MANIASLSPETLAHVLSYLPRDHDTLMARLARVGAGGPVKAPSELPPYATVCREWQRHIEQRTFRQINLPSSELKYFSELVTGSRKAALREIKYHVVLPEYDDAACAVVETDEERRVNHEVFTSAVVALFKVLRDWEDEVGGDVLVPLSLEISQIYSPSDAQRRSRALYKEQRQAVERGERRDLFEGRHYNSWLKLGPLEELPELKSVTRFHVVITYPRPVEAESMARLARKFPALKELELKIMERSEELEERRKDRYDLAVALLPLASLPLVSFTLEVDFNPPRYQFQELPSLLLPTSPEVDQFSLALYAISLVPTLRIMDLSGPIIISSQLFQPPTSIPTTSEFSYLTTTTPHWPSLITYSANFSIVHPSGLWYFVRHPDNPVPHDFVVPPQPAPGSDRGTEMFRTYPDDEAMDGLLGAAGNARHEMPALRMMSLTVRLDDGENSEFEAVWFKAGEKHYLDHRLAEQPVEVGKETFLGGNHVYWWTGKGGDWRPKREVEEAWAGDGCQQWFKGYPQEEEEEDEDEEDDEDD